MKNPFRYFNSSPEVIRLTVMLSIRHPLSLSNVTSPAAKPSRKTAQPPWPSGVNWRREPGVFRHIGDWFALD
jgi:hypothetical protein